MIFVDGCGILTMMGEIVRSSYVSSPTSDMTKKFTSLNTELGPLPTGLNF